MISQLESALRKLKRGFNRSEWLARLLQPVLSDGNSQAGLVMVQIDGLSHAQLTRALEHGEMPFLRQLMKRESYRLHCMYAGVPATTAAVQGELFYGIRQAVPGFSFFDRHSGELVRMIEPTIAARVERELSELSDSPLLAGGSSYANNFTGGAEEPHFCPTARGWGSALRRASPWALLLLLLSNAFSFMRALALIVLEFFIALADLARGVLAGSNLLQELKFVPTRVAITVLLRELVVIGAKIDMARGLPIIHLNLLGYDEQAHRRGPASKFAHWTLKGIDDAVARLWKAAHLSNQRIYDLWIYSDHGQLSVTPYETIFQRSFGAAAADVFSGYVNKPVAYQEGGPWGAQLHRAGQLGDRVRRWLVQMPDGSDLTNNPQLTVAGLGPVALLYWNEPLGSADRAELAQRLVRETGAPLVLICNEANEVTGWTAERKVRLPQDADRVLGMDHPFGRQAAEDLAQLCRHRNVGEFVVCAPRRLAPAE